MDNHVLVLVLMLLLVLVLLPMLLLVLVLAVVLVLMLVLNAHCCKMMTIIMSTSKTVSPTSLLRLTPCSQLK